MMEDNRVISLHEHKLARARADWHKAYREHRPRPIAIEEPEQFDRVRAIKRAAAVKVVMLVLLVLLVVAMWGA